MDCSYHATKFFLPQVVMKVVDLETAQNLFHRTPRGPPIHSPHKIHPLHRSTIHLFHNNTLYLHKINTHHHPPIPITAHFLRKLTGDTLVDPCHLL